jgi:transposase
VGLSINKACAELAFFWELQLSKSQADAMLNQLARSWESEFETLCELLACSAVVHTDETSWSINSVWAFLSEKARVLVFGCRKDADTLAQILSKDTFDGILVSDDAAVYQGFSHAQKYWAHLLRKAIRLTLLHSENEEYRSFLDGLLAVFHKAKGFAADRRLNDAGRETRVAKLFDVLSDVCVVRCGAGLLDTDAMDEPVDETDREFFNLVHELARLMCAGELFTFVLHPGADATNNEAERSLRGAAMDRRTGRTSKTIRGARRRTVLMSVRESLRLHLPAFHLGSVLDEVSRWSRNGESLFSTLLTTFGLDPPTESRLDNMVPLPKTPPAVS